jgi:hypothetical protein
MRWELCLKYNSPKYHSIHPEESVYINDKKMEHQTILDLLVTLDAVTLTVFSLLTLSNSFSSSLAVASPLRLIRWTCCRIYSSDSRLLLMSIMDVSLSSNWVSRCRSASISVVMAASCCSSYDPSVPISFSDLRDSSLSKPYLSSRIAFACCYNSRYSPYSF